MSKMVRLEDLGHELRLLPQKVSEATANVLRLPWFEESARSLCPVDTSALLSSIRTEARGLHEVAIVAGGGGAANSRHRREGGHAPQGHDGASRAPARPPPLPAAPPGRGRHLAGVPAEAGGEISEAPGPAAGGP
ncbi:hypothetical protein H8E65_03390, partial [Candidatus Bathyarchaeota archaeon]|nr:hypothetical protein [Candidatus Bathyarchaeota archaeon]